jgi:hypothetical protein
MATALAALPYAEAHLDVYGLGVSLRGDWPEVIDAVRRDFLWFERPRVGRADVEIVVERTTPDWTPYEGLRAAFITPRDVVYRLPGKTIMDHLGRAISEVDEAEGRLTIRGTDEDIVHDALYYYLLGRTGAHLEARGLPRLHGLGLAGRQGGVAVLLPSGGGKSTLALRALSHDGVKLLSDDSPLLDRHGRLHAFPLRIAVNGEDANTLPFGPLRRIDRVGMHAKFAIDADAFGDRIERRAQPLRHIVIGQRSLNRHGTLEALPRRAAVSALVRDNVIGVGLYQGYGCSVLERGARDIIAKAAAVAGRSASSAACLARARVWRLVLGRDHASNWNALVPLLG